MEIIASKLVIISLYTYDGMTPNSIASRETSSKMTHVEVHRVHGVLKSKHRHIKKKKRKKKSLSFTVTANDGSVLLPSTYM